MVKTEAEAFEQFKMLYGYRKADGTPVLGPYFNKVLSLQVRLGRDRQTLRRWARALNLHTLEGGLSVFPEDVPSWDTDSAAEGI